MIRPPKLMIGHTPHAKTINQLIRFATAIQPIESSEVAVERSHVGTALFAKGGGGSSSPRQGPFQIQSVQDDYVTCFPYDNVAQKTTSTTPVYIAKEDKHQTDLPSETIFGVVHNYTYTSGLMPPGGLTASDANNVFRTDSVTGEFQRLTPPWNCGATGDIIYGDPTPGLGIDAVNEGILQPVTLLIAGRSALWAQVTS